MPPQRHIRFGPPERVFDIQEPTMDESLSARKGSSRLRHFLSSLSLARSGTRLTRTNTFDSLKTVATERVPIPSMMRQYDEAYTTPLPTLSMVVLSITMLGEFLTANVSTPFILFMVKGFNQFKDEAEIAFWTGILVSAFFLTQFITSLLWATIAEKHGRRAVLITSLLGTSITCVVFGTCTTLQQAMCVRLLQGVFGGAIGVARGSVAFVTDHSNEGRAYAILGFCWGMGGVAGAIVGGAFERPAAKWPQIFESVEIFVTYPYLLPCCIAASITLMGSFLACFLGRDGGPRQGAIHLPPEKDNLPTPIPEEDSNPPSPVLEEPPKRQGFVQSIRSVSRKFSNLSNYLPGRRESVNLVSATDRTPLLQHAIFASPTAETPRAQSRVSHADGSAYGYSGKYRSRLASSTSAALRRRSSMAGSLSWQPGSYDVRRESVDSRDLNFAQRLLMANENAVNSVADLWVAAAMNADNEDPFESDLEDEEPAVPEQLEEEEEDNDDAATIDSSRTQRGRGTSTKRLGLSINTMSRRPSRGVVHAPSRGSRPSRSHFSTSRHATSPQAIPRHPSISIPPSSTPLLVRRRSSTSVPSIFSHTGVEVPRAVLDARDILTRLEEGVARPDGLEPIIESRQPSNSSASSDTEVPLEKTPSLISQLPLQVIFQYGVFALHTTTHDQVFMSYLVSDVPAGGLGLTAADFAQLIALMCLAQLAYQFYLYPNLGPPRGKFSHLSMFRIGAALFIPAYLLVIPLRPFAVTLGSDNYVVMAGLIATTTIRYCGSTFGYTAISILLNYMTPPDAIGYANGIAQSIVSLARCGGPALGGYIWSISVRDDPSGYPFSFIVCTVVCAVSVLLTFMIR
ncbi:hypothetical protein F5887DRAFT_951109 [Amanita rubescens]|nr:hypothetical protein F5887DRAFT_951109 [Amanita rubescens]